VYFTQITGFDTVKNQRLIIMFNTITSVEVVIKPKIKSELIRLNLFFIETRFDFYKSKAPVKITWSFYSRKKID
jgi:hypothetical protein